MFVHAQEVGDFGYVVVDMDFDAAAIVPIRHGLRHALDEIADVLDLPSRGSRSEFHRLWEATGPYARPPSRAADRNRTDRGENGTEVDEAGSREVARSLLFLWRRLVLPVHKIP